VVASGAGGQSRVDVELAGVSGELRQNVLAVLSIARESLAERLTDERVARLHARAPREIALALEPFGHYHVEVWPEIVRTENRWSARYTIDPGARVILTGVTVQVGGEGAEEPTLIDAVERFPLARGSGLHQGLYEQGKRSLVDAALERGYLDARFERHELRIDREADTAVVFLDFRTGPRFRFGEVRFEQHVLDPELLQAYVTFERGAPFELHALLRLQARLSGGPYFSLVEVVPRRDLAEGLEIPIQVTLLPRPTHRYGIGVGYGTNTGPRGSFEIELRRLNRRGHRAEGRVTASVIEQSITTSYLIPSVYPSTRVLGLSAGVARLDTETSTSRSLRLVASVGHDRGAWREVLSLSFVEEGFEVGVDDGRASLLTLGGAWSRTEADDPAFPRRGYSVRTRIEAGHEAVISSTTMLRLSVGGKLIVPVGRRIRLLARADVGRLFTPAFRRLPPTARFFAGGDQSVRGFRYQALGPLDEEANVIGGNSLLAGSAEVEFLPLERWGIAAFFDAGNALDGFEGRLERGLGGGIRWLSPVGIIRLDAAFAISRDGSPFRLHFTIGPDL
jgi:translocation and assembly module TamA